MDEIKWMKNIKKALIIFATVFTCFGIMLMLVTLMGARNYNPEYLKMMIKICLFIVLGFTAFIVIAFFIIHIIYKIVYSPNKERIINKEYSREIPNKYSPSIASLVYDLKIDIYKDYTATILWLCTNKYIKLEKKQDNYEFKILKTDAAGLSGSQIYVFNKIVNNTKFDESEFRNSIIKEAQEYLLITDKKRNKILNESTKPIWFMILIIAIIILYCFIKLYVLMVVPILMFCGGIVFIKEMISLADYINIDGEFKTIKDYKRTNKGKQLARELQAFKNFINEYTLISEKDIDYIQILEEYIPYAISLGEADTIEKFVKYNEEYRNLIYKDDNSQ